MALMLLRGLIAGLVVIGVTEVSSKYPRLGALLLTLPLVSILAFVMEWGKHRDLPAISTLARESLILVPLGLPFFVPLAFADRWHLTFCQAFAAGVALASLTIGLWLWLGPELK